LKNKCPIPCKYLNDICLLSKDKEGNLKLQRYDNYKIKQCKTLKGALKNDDRNIR